MPNGVSGSREVISWIANKLPKNTYVNIMSQCQPLYKARDYPRLNRRISKKEYTGVVEWAKQQGLTNLDIQGYHSL